MRIGRAMLIGLIRTYQLVLSPVFPMSCRYHPTCSHYACEALARHGAWRGGWLALARVLRCHPWRAGGFDPVPQRVASAGRRDAAGLAASGRGRS